MYTPGRCVLYGTGSQDSGPSPTTSPGRRNTACHHFSLRCRGWGVRGWTWGLGGAEVVKCLRGGWICENIWRKSFINSQHFLFITCWGILNNCKHQNLFIFCYTFGNLFGLYIERNVQEGYTSWFKAPHNNFYAKQDSYHLTIWSCTDPFAWQSLSPKYGKWQSLFPWSQHRPQHTAHHLRERQNSSV